MTPLPTILLPQRLQQIFDTMIYYYVYNQWLSGDFDQWQIFRKKTGFTNVQSNIESFNASIKRDHTGRKRMSIKAAIEKINEIIIYYSRHKKPFKLVPKFN